MQKLQQLHPSHVCGNDVGTGQTVGIWCSMVVCSSEQFSDLVWGVVFKSWARSLILQLPLTLPASWELLGNLLQVPFLFNQPDSVSVAFNPEP